MCLGPNWKTDIQTSKYSRPWSLRRHFVHLDDMYGVRVRCTFTSLKIGLMFVYRKLSQKSATVAENGDKAATVAEFGDSRTFLRQ